jgi:hypothetical protein
MVKRSPPVKTLKRALFLVRVEMILVEAHVRRNANKTAAGFKEGGEKRRGEVDARVGEKNYSCSHVANATCSIVVRLASCARLIGSGSGCCTTWMPI